MTADELEALAVAKIDSLVKTNGPREPRVQHRSGEETWFPNMLEHFSEHVLHVLELGGDVVVFFDAAGAITGWRDEGRRGAEKPAWIDRDAFLRVVRDELQLPATATLGKLEPAELPPVGWTHEAIIFLKPMPGDRDVLRAWVSPADLRVIQCLYGGPE